MFNEKGLADISAVKIDGASPAGKAADSFSKQPETPYRLVCGDSEALLSFNNNGPTLEELLISYFTGLKTGGKPV